MAVDERGEDVMSDDILSSMQRKTAKKEARRSTCAALRLFNNPTLFEACTHVYARISTTYL